MADDQEKKKKLKQGEIEKITEKADDQDKDFKSSGVEGTKEKKLVPDTDRGSEIVRGEDVVKILRAKGVKI